MVEQALLYLDAHVEQSHPSGMPSERPEYSVHLSEFYTFLMARIGVDDVTPFIRSSFYARRHIHVSAAVAYLTQRRVLRRAIDLRMGVDQEFTRRLRDIVGNLPPIPQSVYEFLRRTAELVMESEASEESREFATLTAAMAADGVVSESGGVPGSPQTPRTPDPHRPTDSDLPQPTDIPKQPSGESDERIEFGFTDTTGFNPGARYYPPTPINRPDIRPAESSIPVTVYLSDEASHRQVEEAVKDLLETAGLTFIWRDRPVLGSWFRNMRAGVRTAVRSEATREAAREAAGVAMHIADTRLVLAQDAAVTATLMQNLGPVITSLGPTKDAVVRVGALLIVKVDWAVHVFQLTAAQQAKLDHQPTLARSPGDIIAALDLTARDATPAPEPPSALG
ncbi:hypothetical protein [Streptomyces fuscigenes]|uniref:hypothetical protein n=1 Tax=Streptomyces fuscigenes TaxID=1528880 RepID=UPI001F47DDB2|nr:hypothetical protein [Streptomyces fuscigenes]MCF3960312.1 hypothetical protein [Streptomyces fuscigenes]